MCESVGKADLLSDHFDGKQSKESVYLPKQSKESVDLPHTCHPSLKTTFALRSSEISVSF